MVYRLKEQRKNKGLTQKKIAYKIGIPITTYASYEQGRRNPSVKNAKIISKVLDLDWTLFFED